MHSRAHLCIELEDHVSEKETAKFIDVLSGHIDDEAAALRKDLVTNRMADAFPPENIFRFRVKYGPGGININLRAHAEVSRLCCGCKSNHFFVVFLSFLFPSLSYSTANRFSLCYHSTVPLLLNATPQLWPSPLPPRHALPPSPVPRTRPWHTSALHALWRRGRCQWRHALKMR
jgi:hypothetical protein